MYLGPPFSFHIIYYCIHHKTKYLNFKGYASGILKAGNRIGDGIKFVYIIVQDPSGADTDLI